MTLLLGLLGLLAGCAAQGPANDPVSRTFSWFDYVAGSDLRRLCGPKAPERWRLVYNAVWDEQVRTYDVVFGAHPAVETHVFSGGIDLEFGPDGLFPEWVGAEAYRALTPAEAGRLRQGLAQALPAPAPEGTFLRSDDFYWAVSRCRDGRFDFAAWQRETPGFQALPFLAVLRPFDGSGRAVNPPRRLDLPPLATARMQPRSGRGGPPVFALQVGENGLRTGGALF